MARSATLVAILGAVAAGVRIVKVPRQGFLTQVDEGLVTPFYKNPTKYKITGNSTTTNLFDNRNDGVLGGIIEICIKARTHIQEMRVNFAGNWIRMGKTTMQISEDCWELNDGEYITYITTFEYPRPNVPSETRVSGLKLFTQSGRSKMWGTVGERHLRISLTRGRHLLGFYGHIGDGDQLQTLGFYTGLGSGRGFWAVVPSCMNCLTDQYEYQDCITVHEQSTKTNFSSWSKAVTSEFSAGFEFNGVSIGISDSVDFQSSATTDTLTQADTLARAVESIRSTTSKSCTTFQAKCPPGTRLFEFRFVIKVGAQVGTIPTGLHGCRETAPTQHPLALVKTR